MNPAFIIIILISAITLWFFLSGAFRPLGRFFHHIWNDAKDAMSESEDEENKGN